MSDLHSDSTSDLALRIVQALVKGRNIEARRLCDEAVDLDASGHMMALGMACAVTLKSWAVESSEDVLDLMSDVRQRNTLNLLERELSQFDEANTTTDPGRTNPLVTDRP